MYRRLLSQQEAGDSELPAFGCIFWGKTNWMPMCKWPRAQGGGGDGNTTPRGEREALSGFAPTAAGPVYLRRKALPSFLGRETS